MQEVKNFITDGNVSELLNLFDEDNEEIESAKTISSKIIYETESSHDEDNISLANITVQN